jgi:hypothetical protein
MPSNERQRLCTLRWPNNTKNRRKLMWVLVFIYFYDTMPYVEKVTVADTMENCFLARDALSIEVGKGDGYFKAGQQAICINMNESDV